MAPLYKPSFWAFWEKDPRSCSFLREWAATFPVVWGRGALFTVAASLSDLEIEATIRDGLYQRIYWTGNQVPNDNPYTDYPAALLRWDESYKDLNEGRGPQWSCGPLAATYVGLLAAYGIAARRVWSSHPTSGHEDNVVEFWSRELRQWVLVIPHTNTHFEDNGKRLSLAEWAPLDRCGRTPLAVTISGDGNPKYCDTPELYRWKGWSGHPCVMRGNVPHAGGERTPESWQWLQLMPPIGKAVRTMPDIKGTPAIIPFGSYDFASVTDGPHVLN